MLLLSLIFLLLANAVTKRREKFILNRVANVILLYSSIVGYDRHARRERQDSSYFFLSSQNTMALPSTKPIYIYIWVWRGQEVKFFLEEFQLPGYIYLCFSFVSHEKQKKRYLQKKEWGP